MKQGFYVEIYEDGEVSLFPTNQEPYISVTNAKAIINFLKSHIKAVKTDDYVEFLNFKAIQEIEDSYNESRRLRKEQEAAEKLLPKQSSPCFIYLAEDGFHGAYKIGRTVNIENRQKQLRTANADLKIVMSWEGVVDDEKALHEKFRDKRINLSEWFSLS